MNLNNQDAGELIVGVLFLRAERGYSWLVGYTDRELNSGGSMSNSQENPYQPPELQVEQTGKRGQGNGLMLLPTSKVYSIAIYQKCVLCLILANIISSGAQIVAPQEFAIVLIPAGFSILLAGFICVILLSSQFFSKWITCFIALLSLLPLFSLIALLIIDRKSTNTLRRHEIRVGFLGARMSDVRKLKPLNRRRRAKSVSVRLPENES